MTWSRRSHVAMTLVVLLLLTSVEFATWAGSADATESSDVAAEPFGPTFVALQCRIFAFLRPWSSTHELTLDPVNPGVGSRVTVRHRFASGARIGAVPIAAGELVPSSVIRVSGAFEGLVTARGPVYGHVEPRTELEGAVMEASFVVSGAGPLDLQVESVVFEHPLVITRCDGGDDPVDDPEPTTMVARYDVSEEPGPSSTSTAADFPPDQPSETPSASPRAGTSRGALPRIGGVFGVLGLIGVLAALATGFRRRGLKRG